MGTRAAFWVGDPRNLTQREWLGCNAFDGYPDGLPEVMLAESDEQFRIAVEKLSKERGFATPAGGWPYPWDDDIFLTDYTYAWFDGRLNVACYHHGFVSADDAVNGKWPEGDDPTCVKVPADNSYDRSQPDSIMIFSI